ncbi:oligosaccharide repeat unit polymerase, partial [Providencia rettgeri]|nr:oligosaccharide repeat unit polymerase [Providencia rettgeri]
YNYGYGVVGFDSDTSPEFIVLINKFFVPLFFIEIYFFYFFNSNRVIYFVNLFLFLFLTLYKGYTGPIVHLGYLFIFRLYFNGKLNIKTIFIIIFVGLLSSPIIRIIKNLIIRSFISGGTLSSELDVLYKISDVDNFIELYYVYFQRVFERFELISATYFIIDKLDTIQKLYESNQFLPFYLYHWLPQTIEKILVLSPIYDITQDSAQRIIASLINSGYQWQIHIGFFGWSIISPIESLFYFIYATTLIFISLQLTKMIDLKNNSIEQLTWLLVLSFVTHGWYNDFILYIQGLFIFLILVNIINTINFPKLKYMP